MIRIQELFKNYGANQVLSGINTTFDRGKIYGIVGLNGAGKTTLFRCLAGLETYEGGIGADIFPLKNHLGFLETNPQFLSKMTGWEYLKLCCTARGIDDDDFIHKNIFDLPLNEYAANYSTGMKKKLALMAIILQKNEVFILDEPFNGVDIHSNLIISDIIVGLKRNNKTVLLSSHIFSTLTQHCDRMLLLEAGKFVSDQGPEGFHIIDALISTQTSTHRLDVLGL